MTDTPVLDVLMERFIDAFAPDGHENCGQSSAIRRAGAVMMFSPLLTQAFRAVCITYFGQCTGSPRIISRGYKAYCQTLNHLQIALWDPRQSRSEGVFATVILLMAYEVQCSNFIPVHFSIQAPLTRLWCRASSTLPRER